jgi:tRNA threonylcarbamoyladenosine biosynthesis protein TsaB
MILALQTAGPVTCMWLFDAQDQPDPQKPTLVWESGRDLATELLGKITTLLRRHNADLGNLESIVVFSGPGSFTSLRIGHTVANALSDGLGIKVVGAMGENWISDGLAALSDVKVGAIAMPVYGSEPNITKPKH